MNGLNYLFYFLFSRGNQPLVTFENGISENVITIGKILRPNLSTVIKSCAMLSSEFLAQDSFAELFPVSVCFLELGRFFNGHRLGPKLAHRFQLSPSVNTRLAGFV